VPAARAFRAKESRADVSSYFGKDLTIAGTGGRLNAVAPGFHLCPVLQRAKRDSDADWQGERILSRSTG
jgi:hypothetical protein